MNIIHRRAVALGRLIAERSLIKQASSAQIEIIVGLGFDADGAHGRFEPEFAEHDRGIAADLNARTDLAKYFCLLENKHFDPMMPQRNCRRQSAYATTSYEHAHVSSPLLDKLS